MIRSPARDLASFRISSGTTLTVIWRLVLPALAASSSWAAMRLAGFLGEPQGGDEVLLGDFVAGAFIHDDVGLVADVDEVEVGAALLFVRGVHDELAFDPADAHGAERSGPGDVGDGQRRGGAEDGQDVGLVLAVGREQEGLDLDLVVPALGEQGADGAVGEAAGEDFLLGGTALALEVASRETAGGGRLLAVVDRQREEILAGLRLGGGDRGGEDDRLAQLDGDGAVGLLGKAAGFDGDLLTTERNGDFMGHVRTAHVPPRNFSRLPGRPRSAGQGS